MDQCVYTQYNHISGSKRRQLLAEPEIFSQAAQMNVRVHGPYHASHLYSDGDVEKIVGGLSKVYFSVLSNVTGQPFAASPSSELLKQCLTVQAIALG